MRVPEISPAVAQDAVRWLCGRKDVNGRRCRHGAVLGLWRGVRLLNRSGSTIGAIATWREGRRAQLW